MLEFLLVNREALPMMGFCIGLILAVVGLALSHLLRAVPLMLGAFIPSSSHPFQYRIVRKASGYQLLWRLKGWRQSWVAIGMRNSAGYRVETVTHHMATEFLADIRRVHNADVVRAKHAGKSVRAYLDEVGYSFYGYSLVSPRRTY